MKTRSPKTKIYLAEVIPRIDADVSELNHIIGYVCNEYGATLIKTHQKFKLRSYQYCKDGIHLSDKGTATLLKI